MSVRRCRGCGVLLRTREECLPCDTQQVHVITTLGAIPDLPGRHDYARLGRVA